MKAYFRADLVSALSGLDVDDFTHLEMCLVFVNFKQSFTRCVFFRGVQIVRRYNGARRLL